MAAIADRIDHEADVAQLVEQLIRNQQVNGSSPFVGSIRASLNHPLLPQKTRSYVCFIKRIEMGTQYPLDSAFRTPQHLA
jgi:hypothetical protein